jgi:hypothetical protein
MENGKRYNSGRTLVLLKTRIRSTGSDRKLKKEQKRRAQCALPRTRVPQSQQSRTKEDANRSSWRRLAKSESIRRRINLFERSSCVLGIGNGPLPPTSQASWLNARPASLIQPSACFVNQRSSTRLFIVYLLIRLALLTSTWLAEEFLIFLKILF